MMKFYLFNQPLKTRRYAGDNVPENFTKSIPYDIKITKLSFIIINNLSDNNVYIGKIYNVRKPTTYDKVISVRNVVRIKINLDVVLKATQGKHVDEILKSTEPISLEHFEKIRDAILEANIETINKSYFNFERLNYDEYKDIFPQFIDSFNVAFNLFGFDPKDIPPLTEEQILDFDIDTMFPDKVSRTPNGIHFFYNNGKILYLHKVHNTLIERCLGVDLIYNFIDEHRMIFIQYKCTDENKKFYISSDSHFRDIQMDKMKSIPEVNECYNFKAESREDLRICKCPVFIKLCHREIKEQRTAPYGFYYSICIWNYIYYAAKTFITLDDTPRLSNEQFLKLVKDGLIGSTSTQSKIIESYLIEKAEDKRLKLIFTEIKDKETPSNQPKETNANRDFFS